MVTTPYNWKQWLKKHYPDIQIYPVYGLEAYTFDKPLSTTDMMIYNVQQLANGHYIVFPGKTAEQVLALMHSIHENGLNYTRPQRATPTTFASFERYLTSTNQKPMFRTHISRQTAAEALHTKSDDPSWNHKRDWYMYEFTTFDTSYFNGPFIVTENNTTVLLIKASTSTYISKKQLLTQKFARMLPLRDQLIIACSKSEWDHAADLCTQYMSILFEVDGHVDKDQLKEAYDAGDINLFIQIRSNLIQDDESDLSVATVDAVL